MFFKDSTFKEQATLKMDILSMKHAVNEMEQNCDALREQVCRRSKGFLISFDNFCWFEIS